MRTLRALRLDLRLQWRQGFYGAYMFVIVVYVVILRARHPLLSFVPPAKNE